MALQPDVQQLVAILGSVPGDQTEQRLAQVDDWAGLIENAASWAMVLPLQAVVDASGQALPLPESERLTELGTRRALSAARQTSQLGEILAHLSAAGIDALAYKGPTLAYLAFGHLGARECSDLDLLVHPQDYRRAVGLLVSMGFRYGYPPPTRCQLAQAYEVSMVHEQRGLVVDLHRSFFAGNTTFSLSLRSHTPFQVRLMGHHIPTLEPTELLLLLCVHGTKHCWRQLRWIHDLHGLLQRQRINWDELHRMARADGAVRAVSLGLTLAHDLFGAPCPEPFRPCAATRRLAEESKGYLGRKRLGRPAQHRYHWHSADTLEHRLRYLLWTLFFPHELDLSFVDLPEPLYPLYFLIRPYRILYERLTGASRRRKKNTQKRLEGSTGSSPPC